MTKESPYKEESRKLNETVKKYIPYSYKGYNLKQFYCDSGAFHTHYMKLPKNEEKLIEEIDKKIIRVKTKEFEIIGRNIKNGIEKLLIVSRGMSLKDGGIKITIGGIDFMFRSKDGTLTDVRTDCISAEIYYGRVIDVIYQKNYKENPNIAVWSLAGSSHGW